MFRKLSYFFFLAFELIFIPFFKWLLVQCSLCNGCRIPSQNFTKYKLFDSYAPNLESGLSLIRKNLSSEKIFWWKSENFETTNFFKKSEKFSDKIFWCCLLDRFLKIFRRNFDRNIFWKSVEIFRNLRILLLIGLSPCLNQPCSLQRF